MTTPDEAPRQRIEPTQLDAIRRQAGLPVAEDRSCWTACSAPSTQLVITRDGALRGCDSGARDLAAGESASAAWSGTAFEDLRKQLGDGRFDPDYCRGCRQWIDSELPTAAPPLRDHAPATDEGQVARGPTQLTIRLPLVEDAHARVLQDVERALPHLERLVLDAAHDDALAERFVAEVLALLRQHAATQPHLHVRTPCDQPETLLQALDKAEVHSLECRLDAASPEVVAAFGSCAQKLEARRSARFVFATDNWFEFEELAKACAAIDTSLDLRVLGPDGDVPLAAAASEELSLVRDALFSTSGQCRGDDRHSSLSSDAHARLTDELRHVARHRAQQELAADGSLEHTVLSLPNPEHAWFEDDRTRAWWLPGLFGRASLPCIREWLLATVASHREHLSTEAGTWLRVMVQRLASDQHLTDLLELLRELYSDEAQRLRLAEFDRAFAESMDLERFGGPWSPRLGLLQERDRKPPFAVPSPRPAPGAAQPGAPDTNKPDTTVLIPSYRHELYIEETLRSVLAQTYGNFRILVVDDRSPDATVERARSIDDPRIEVRVNATNLGLGNSVLQALETIETPYVALLNSDDIFHPERLGKCREILEHRQHVRLVTTGIDLVDHQGGEITPSDASLVLDGKKVFDWVQWFSRVKPPEDLPQEELFAALLERNFLVTSSNLVARTDWLRAQADGLKSLKYCLDWQLFLEAALEGALHHLHEPLIAYRLHATNTVWFREGRRWSYYLEVNRVAAEALQRFVAQDRLDDAKKLHQVVDSVARHLATNTEMDGLAMFLNCSLDALQLDDAANNRPEVQDLIESLNLRAENRREAVRAFEDSPSAMEDRRQALRLLLGELAAEQEALERDQKHWLRGYCESLEVRLQSCWKDRDLLETEKQGLYDKLGSLREYAGGLEARIREGEERFESVRADKQQAIDDLIERDRKLEELRLHRDEQIAKTKRVRQELEAQVRQTRVDLEARLAKRIQEVDQARANLGELRSAHAKLEQAVATAQDALTETQNGLAKARSEQAATAEQLAATTTALNQEKAQADDLKSAKEQLESQRGELIGKVASLREEIDRLLQTREYRAGNFIWNKMPLAYISRRGKKWYRRLWNAKDRAKMMFKSRGKTDGSAVVAACWSWPIYSHTFVYQEMCSLNNTGLNVQLFHWDLGSTDQLHAAFQYLFDNRTQLQPVHETHRKDKEHFEKTKPGKLRSFLERISPLCGKSVEELEKEPIVMQGCTWARMAELANARYIHSYFFYDQSFMAMQAAWLLDLPRGVSCYADHMMDDYPWKFVPLHIELCDVIVATSARIKQELSGLSGGKYDDKIIVKPNGVDGERFLPRQRPARKPEDPFEVLSVSRIEPKKGLTHLVEAIADLKKRGHTVIAHIIGSKDEHSAGSLEYAAEFEACIKEHNLQDQVILHGMMKQEDMPPIIDKCRAFVAPYVETESGDKDGIPTAMLEALASSLPVITTNSGSIVEVIDDGVEGIVVGQRDSLAFANALEKVMTDSDLEQTMAKNARARFDKDFDIKVTEKRLHERIAGFLAAKA